MLNLGASEFELIGRHHSKWKADALKMRELDANIRLRRSFRLRHNADENLRISTLIVSDRHLLAMLHNGVEPGRDVKPYVLRLIRSTKFAHHRMIYAYNFWRLKRTIRMDRDAAYFGGESLLTRTLSLACFRDWLVLLFNPCRKVFVCLRNPLTLLLFCI
jgi:hypothetical protein